MRSERPHTDEIVERVAESAGRVIDRKLIAHVIDYHLPTPQCGPLRAAPWAGQHIPDVECAQMLEAIEGEGATLPDLCERFDQPRSLIKRELAAYCRRHDRWTLVYALQAS